MEKTPVQKKVTRRSSTPLKVYCLPDERAVIEENAKAAGKSVSAFLLAVGQGYKITGVVDAKEVREMAKISGDLGRLGGLLKWWLTDDVKTAKFTPETIRAVLSKIDDSQLELGSIMSKVIRPRLDK
ncbi:conjugal transfer transcriptional regulator TraJ [Shewanella frigidimarina]|uniref:conjugal transfer transcriptional regulator TraJ n=1 Tax=Shewanella frigidimarina TaxID=56812 RepID=UPI003D790800